MSPTSADRPDGLTGGILTVDLAALRANYALMVARAGPARCAGVVKADAYGLGVAHVAPALHAAGCRDFFVAQLSEALDLRPRLPDDAVLYILNGLQPGGEERCADAGLVPVLNGLEQVEAWALVGAARSTRLSAVLQLDSGMSRLGLSADDLRQVVERGWLAHIDLRVVMSHLACADAPAHPANAAQRELFDALRGLIPDAPTSLANSGGVFLDGRRDDLVRPGIALYGASPLTGWDVGLQPVVTLDAHVIQTRTIPVGATVGYGATFTAPHAMRTATVAVGYADGWPRRLGNRGAVFFKGVRLPIIGRVSMDSMTVDVGALPADTLRLGNLVELIGPHQTLEALAADCGTIAYEILTGLGRRLARRYVDRPVKRTGLP